MSKISITCQIIVAHLPNYFLFSLVIRHVLLPKEIAKLVPKKNLMSETEWRSLGVQQSQGWEHYMKHDPGKLI